METHKELDEATALLKLIADSEKARQEGRWLTHEQFEKLLREKYGIKTT